MQDWDDIRIFLAVSRAGSLNAAARLLGLTQPTISQRMALLESRLSVALVRRTQDGLILTDAGHLLRERALAMEEHAQAVSRQILRHDENLSGNVRITATEGIGAFWLTRRLASLSAAHPGISIEVLLDNNLTDLMKREADIAIRLMRPMASDLIGRRVGEMAFGLYASNAYVQRHSAPADFDDIHRHRLVTFPWDAASGGERWRDLVAGHGNIAFRSNSQFGHVHAVRAGYGVGLLPTYIGAEYPELAMLLPDHNWARRDIWLVAHRDVRMNARIRVVYKEIVAQFALDRRIVDAATRRTVNGSDSDEI